MKGSAMYLYFRGSNCGGQPDMGLPTMKAASTHTLNGRNYYLITIHLHILYFQSFRFSYPSSQSPIH